MNSSNNIKLPWEIVSKIFTYSSSPAASVFKAEYPHMYDDDNEVSFYTVWLENYSSRAKRNYRQWLNEAPVVETDDDDYEDEGVHYFR